MNIEIRIYKRYDTDLLSLHDAGYSVTKMMEKAVSSYANGLPCHFFIDEMLPFDMNDKKSVRLRLKFKDNDYNTVNLIRNIKHGYRSNFCKQVLRNSLIQQNLLCYMSDASTFPMHDQNAKNLNQQAFPNLQMCSEYKRETSKLRFLGKDIVVKHEKGFKYKPYQDTFAAQSQPQTQMMQMQNIQALQQQIADMQQAMAGYSQMLMQGQVPMQDSSTPAVSIHSIQQQKSLNTENQYAKPAPLPVHSAAQSHTDVPLENAKREEPPVSSYEEPHETEEENNEAPQLADNDNLMAMFDGL